jgi:predicted extracellular nuclease
MTKLYTTLTLLLFFSMLGFSQTKNPITIAFYNCENFFDTKDDKEKQDDDFLPTAPSKWDETKYKNKLEKVAQVLDSSVVGDGLPAIAGMVEIENKDVLEDLVTKTQFNKKRYATLCTTGADNRSIDCGLIYDLSMFTLETSEELNATNLKLGEYATRNILYARLKATNGDVFNVFVNHWPSRRDGEIESEPKRLYAAEVLRNKINEIQKKDGKAKIIVMGDFNDHPDNNSILNILKASDKPKGKSDLFNPYFTLDKEKQGTHFFNNIWRCLDQIMVSQSLINSKKGFKFNPKNAFILRKDFVLFKNKKTGEERPNRTYGADNKYFNGYSDHLSIYITLD